MPKNTIDLIKLAPEDADNFSKTFTKLTYLGTTKPDGFIVGFEAFDSALQELLPTFEQLFEVETKTNTQITVRKTLSASFKLTSDLKSEISLELKKLKSPYLVKAVIKNESGLERLTFETVTTNLSQTQNAVLEAWLTFLNSQTTEINLDQIKKSSVSVLITHKNSPDISGTAFVLGGKNNYMEIQGHFGELSPIQRSDIAKVDSEKLEEISYQIQPQSHQLIFDGKNYKSISVAPKFQKVRKIDPEQIKKIAQALKPIHSKVLSSVEVKFEIVDQKIYFNDININIEKGSKNEDFRIGIDLEVLENLKPIIPGLVSGFGKYINNPNDLKKLKRGDIAILNSFKKTYLPALKKASGFIVQNSKNLSTEVLPKINSLGLATVVGTIKNLPEQIITLNGQSGKIYKGAFSSTMSKTMQVNEKIEVAAKINKTATKVFLHLRDDLSANFGQNNFDGIGPVHPELFFTRYGVHPQVLIKKSRLKLVLNSIYSYLESLATSNRDLIIIYQVTDFKSNELINLDGGSQHETPETNPMLGKRGASRHLENLDLLIEEFGLIKKLRNSSGLKNIWISLPFIRTSAELKEIKKALASVGLYRSNSFKLLITLATPANIYSLENFISEGIDGLLIDYYDLANLLYGKDFSYLELLELKDNSLDLALEAILKPAHKAKLFTGIFNIPAENKQLINKVVSLGIKSVSVQNQYLDQTRQELYRAEKQLVSKK